LQTICDTRLNTSHIGLYSKPVQQNMQRLERLFNPYMADMLRKPRR
jgi:hypothetical protein